MHPRLREHLIELGTQHIRHSGRTFFEHLKGVHDLLRDWGSVEPLCLAGLYHSIYGNAAFAHKTMTERSELKLLIGDGAERLVHLFNTKTRPLFEDVESKHERRQLREIEAANLLEQGGSTRTLRKLSRKQLSNGARIALAMELSRRV